jgi:hypothetical protein
MQSPINKFLWSTAVAYTYVVTFIVWFFEVPKIFPITESFYADQYQILPHVNGPLSRSSPIFLICHWFLSISLVSLVCLYFIYLIIQLFNSITGKTAFTSSPEDLKLLKLFSIALIAGNTNHLGDLSSLQANIINAGLCIILFALCYQGQVADFWYLAIYSLPVWLNVLAYVAIVSSK